mmetsp:Transcript_39713/g.104879  ORF Transcript_39713/g.104879 Transcript_39713/m.104879 type:complete len:260 (+) Transcript_39713:908-1687(+)
MLRRVATIGLISRTSVRNDLMMMVALFAAFNRDRCTYCVSPRLMSDCDSASFATFLAVYLGDLCQTLAMTRDATSKARSSLESSSAFAMSWWRVESFRNTIQADCRRHNVSFSACCALRSSSVGRASMAACRARAFSSCDAMAAACRSMAFFARALCTCARCVARSFASFLPDGVKLSRVCACMARLCSAVIARSSAVRVGSRKGLAAKDTARDGAPAGTVVGGCDGTWCAPGPGVTSAFSLLVVGRAKIVAEYVLPYR